MIIGLVGKIGAGKDSFAKILLNKFNFDEQIRFSDPLTEFMIGIGLELNRENYMKVGYYLRKIFGKKVVIDTIIRRIKDKSDKKLVVNGIRYKIEFDAIKSLGGIIVGIITNDEIRFQRINERKRFDREISWEEFLEYDKRETEVEIDDLLKMTDYTIENNGTLEDLENEIKKLLAIIKKY
ncbi:MAG: AAA family ATPase [Candidatus Helarchaeota archaeon]